MNIKKTVIWLVSSIFLACSLYLGYYKGITGFRNISNFYAVFVSIISFSVYDKDIKELMRKNGRSVPAWVDTIFDVAVTSVFAYYGNIIVATAYLISLLNTNSGFSSSVKSDDHEDGKTTNGDYAKQVEAIIKEQHVKVMSLTEERPLDSNGKEDGNWHYIHQAHVAGAFALISEKLGEINV